MKIKRKTYIATIIVASFLIMMVILNVNSMKNAKNVCVNNNKTPIVKHDFLAFNWSVSCR
ncbi:hypothetical protein Q9251_18910 [Alkalihalobacillus macyae]|uniref:hypothetical protein n=1 Tax=Guptibacillus hwajinpoensis TaxID=208199 RepID=UPI00273CD508|nr:hypothetical protein [Alkalihalobacillus macyae]MDP4552954.1 hypothetical protein [Alkalihalobacillus macyae]